MSLNNLLILKTINNYEKVKNYKLSLFLMQYDTYKYSIRLKMILKYNTAK